MDSASGCRGSVDKPSVVVTDGDQRASLATVRSLGAAGWDVHVVASRLRSLAGSSRFATSRQVAAEPRSNPEAFRQDLRAVVTAVDAQLVIPMTEAALLAVADGPDLFDSARLPFPDRATLIVASDKGEVQRHATSLGIAVPTTVTLDTPAAAACLDLSAVDFPVALKPARSVSLDGRSDPSFRVAYASNPRELKERLGKLPPAAFPLLVQRVVVGPGIGVFVLLDEREVYACFGHRRVREKPPSGGVSVFRVSADVPPDLREQSVTLLRTIGWRGVAMVEYKVDTRTGEPYLMEVNPRLWGSLQLAIDAGVDFPVLLADWVLGRPSFGPAKYPACASRWFWGEVDHAIARARSGFRNGVVAGLRETFDCLREQLRPGGVPVRSEVFRWSDPRPWLRESLDWFGAV